MRNFSFHPLFAIGLLIRFAFIAGMAPAAVFDWYVPFLDMSTTMPVLDPWTTWVSSGGAPAAFPYGYAMWLACLPMVLIAKLAGIPVYFGYVLTLLITDIAMLAVLHWLVPGKKRLTLVAYWLSPIVILATYGLGLNDLIPTLLLTLSILCMQRFWLKPAGALCAAAISAKLSMVVALPFFLIYLYNNRALRFGLRRFCAGFAACALVLGIPFLFSGSGLEMLFSNPEMGKIYRLSLAIGGGISIYLVPLIYTVMLYIAWRVRRINFELFLALAGMAFLLIVLMTPASPGWFIWVIPFLLSYQAVSGLLAAALLGIFSGLYVLSTLLITSLHFVDGYSFDLGEILHISGQQGAHTASIMHTAMVALGVVLVIRIWREAVNHNEFFRLSRRPFVIGIEGDSGSGKDTYAEAICGLIGLHSVAKLSGDDYHLWDRQKPIWQVMTHLNPMANDLEGFCNDLISLVDGKSIQSRHYDHQSGRMSKPFRIKSNDFIIASGLHALYLPILRDCYNLKVFLDTDERLRRYFKLKRDVLQRGHTVEKVLDSFEKRESDSARFIRPQSAYADLVLSLQAVHPMMLEDLDGEHSLRLKLVAKSRHGFNELSLHRVLVGICGLHVDILVSSDSAEVQMTIEGDPTSADMALAAKILCPRVLEFLDISPQWQDGMLGLMQLITLSHICQAMTKRFVK